MKIKLFVTIIITLFTVNGIAQTSVHWNDSARQPAFKFQRFTDKEWETTSLASPNELKWFTDSRFGMFIHLGVSSLKGVELGWGKQTHKKPDSGIGSVPDSVYDHLYKDFKLENFEAKQLVKIAKDAGMKYIVVITKHHDGFHMWNTAFSEYNIMKTPFDRDYLKEFADAVHESGLKLGFYYSQRDWYHPDYDPIDEITKKDLDKRGLNNIPLGEKVHISEKQKRYQQYMYSQIGELLTKYGKVDILWFDAVWWGGMFTQEMWNSESIYRLARKLQPGIIINNRASIPGDFDTPEQHVGDFQNYRPWETCMTITNSWAWKPDQKPKSAKECISILASTAGGDGNLLLNIGPTSDGAIESGEIKVLEEIGRWLKVNGESIYRTRGGVYYPSVNFTSTYKGSKLFLHLLNIQEEKLILPAIDSRKITKAYFLANNQPVEAKQVADIYEFSLPKELPDELNTVLVVELDKTLNGIGPIKTLFNNIEKGNPKTHDL
ncbi:alpha-L-fucosidase [Draconibacterium sp.]|jgi:alpha-L-fucosidase